MENGQMVVYYISRNIPIGRITHFLQILLNSYIEISWILVSHCGVFILTVTPPQRLVLGFTDLYTMDT